MEGKQVINFKRAQSSSKIKPGSDLSPEIHQEVRTKEKLSQLKTIITTNLMWKDWEQTKTRNSNTVSNFTAFQFPRSVSNVTIFWIETDILLNSAKSC